jgi:voltage-gated potassium channel Kch
MKTGGLTPRMISDWLRYKFDNLMSRGTGALIASLFVLSIVMILAVALFVHLLSPEGRVTPVGQLFWMGLLRTLDPGTMGGDIGSPTFLAGMFAVTVGGIFVVSTLIGILSSGLEGRIAELRKGRSVVVERNHTVVLGWSPQIFTIISELAEANANQGRSCIAVLADRDKVEMEDEIRARISSTHNTHVVCRSGSPMDLNDIEIVNPHEARAIIVLPPENEDSDVNVIKSVLALVNNPQRRLDYYHIVASIRSAQNMEAARLVARDEACLILADDLISRIIAQTCRQSGLSVIYHELLDFQGDEIYLQAERSLVGKSFAESLFAYEDSAVIGLLLQDGGVCLNPPMETRIGPNDQVIAISRDDDTVIVSDGHKYEVNDAAIKMFSPRTYSPERTLVLGWNQRAPTFIRELDRYVVPGSQVTIVGDDDADQMRLECECDGLLNQTVTFSYGDVTNRRTLDRLDIPAYQHVILLSDIGRHDPQQADARTLVTLLHLRDIAERTGHRFSIVSEILDLRNRELAEVAHVDDFIVSNRLISLILAQISENKHLMEVFNDLFNPEGSEIYLKHAEDYVQLGVPLNFYTLLESARRRNEVAIGYRLRAEANDSALGYGLHINPRKSDLVTFSEGDRVVVLAES